MLAMRTGYKGDPREILHFASWHATDREEAGRKAKSVRVFVTAREEFTDRYRPLSKPHAVKRTWKEGGMTVVKDIEHGRRPPQPLLNCYVLKTNAARAAVG